MTLPIKHVSMAIDRPAQDVYEFASNPENLPKWASGLSGLITKVDDHWVSISPMGKVKVVFCKKNDFGIIDHYVTLETGQTFYNPFRVIDNEGGSEVIFTLFRHPEVSQEDFNRDAATVLKDLSKLRELMEK